MPRRLVGRRLGDASSRIAHVLVDGSASCRGTRPLRAPNRPMLVACWLAVLKAGGVAVTTMPLLRPRELTEVIERADVRLALTDASVASDLDIALAARPSARSLRFNSAAPGSLDARLTAHAPRFATVPTSADDPAIIAFTSGTTGHAKATVHGHRDILAVTDAYGRHVVKPRPDDVFIGSPPIAFT